MRTALGWRASAKQWCRVARRKSLDERVAAIRAARYCHSMFVQMHRQQIGGARDASGH